MKHSSRTRRAVAAAFVAAGLTLALASPAGAIGPQRSDPSNPPPPVPPTISTDATKPSPARPDQPSNIDPYDPV